MVERILQKLAVLSVRWRRFHGAEKIKNKKRNIGETVVGKNVNVCHMQAFADGNTQPAERKTETQPHRQKGGDGQRERDG